MRSATFYVAYIVRKIWALLALALVLVAVSLSVLRFSLPYLDQQKQVLENYLSDQFGNELRIGSITAEWKGMGPAIVLRDIQLVADANSPIHLDISETTIELDFWDSVLERQIQSNKFDLQNLRISIDLDSLQRKDSDYPIVAALEKLFLQQLQSFSISNSSILLITPSDQQTVLVDQLSWFNQGERHQGEGQLQIAEIAKNSASFILDLYGNENKLSGTFFAKGEELDLSPWINEWLKTPYELTESRGSFVMWANIEEKSLTSVQLDLSNSRFSWQVDGSPMHAAVLGGQIIAAPLKDSWVMNLDNFSLMLNEQLSTSSWRAQIDNKGNMTLNSVEPFQLDPFMSFLPLVTEQTSGKWLEALQPKGLLSRLQLGVNFAGEVNLQADVDKLSWHQLQVVPGLDGAKASILWSNSSGKLSLNSEDNVLRVSDNLPRDIAFNELSAVVQFEMTPNGLEISSDAITLSSKALTIHSQFLFRTDDQLLSLSANIDTLDVAELQYFYPANLMGENTKDYLTRSLQTGTVSGAELIWHGVLGDFPFKQKQGVFQASVDIQGGKLKFDPQWPALTDLDINLLFENDGLWMTSDHGKLMDVRLANVKAVIPTLASGATLDIDAQGLASGEQVRVLMENSSLAASLGKVFQEVQVEDKLDAQLNLHIPLANPKVVASGKATLSDSRVWIRPLDMSFEHAKGEISFVNDKVSFNNLSAVLFGQPVTIDFKGQQQTNEYGVDIKLSGDWQFAKLLDDYQPSLSNYLAGSTAWQAKINLLLPAEGYEYTAILSTDLAGLESQLPAPFAKNSEQSRPFLLDLAGNKQASVVKMTLDDNIVFNGNLPHQTMQFSRAHLSVGESELVGMGLGFSISANVNEIDGDAWYKTINDLFSGESGKGISQNKPIIEAPKRIFISADTGLFASQKLTNLQLIAKNTNDSWLLDINAKETRMEVALFKDWLGQGVNINADFIELTSWQSPSTEEKKEISKFSLNLSQFPPINFSCKRCRLLNNNLGKVDFRLSRAATGMHIDNLRLKNDHGLLNAEGDWFVNNGVDSTRLSGEFSSSDFGAFLKGFDFNSGIKDSNANAKFDLSWQQAPYKFNVATLNGDLDWGLSDGYLTEVTDKGSRIFSILSLDSLVRKLKLDFRDVFAKGFFYDNMKGSFQINQGVVDTKDTVVDGGAGEINMYGFADLNTQQLNYEISFAPKVTSSLPVIVAWMVNPATALAALALDQMLTSAKVISNIKFSLSGTFDNPVVEELGRDSKEISLPAKLGPKDLPEQKLDGHNLDAPVDIDFLPEEDING